MRPQVPITAEIPAGGGRLIPGSGLMGPPIPLLGEAHPLRRRYRRSLTYALAVASFAHVAAFAAWFIVRLIQGDPVVPKEIQLVRYREIGVELSQVPKAPPALPTPPSISGRARAVPPKLPTTGVVASPDPAPAKADDGAAGRRRAKQEVAETLASTSASVSSILQDLSSSLSQGGQSGTPRPGRRDRTIRSGRGGGELSGGTEGHGGSGTSGDLKGSAIAGSLVEMATVTDIRSGGGGRGGGPAAGEASAGGSSSSPYRSDASLLAVVRKYAPAIQYCYDNELKKDPSLKGKIVVSLTVVPTGEVEDARIVEDHVRSEALSACVLSQIRRWKFPAIAAGTTIFRTPFVFRPPS